MMFDKLISTQVVFDNVSDFKMSHKALKPFEDNGPYCHRNLKGPDEMDALKTSMLVSKSWQ